MQKIDQLRIRKRASATGTSPDYVRTDRVPAGQLWCIQHIAYENETGARGTFRRLIEGHGYEHFLGEHPSPGAGELITWNGELWLMPGEDMAVRQATCTAADALALYATGYIIFTDLIEV